ncbi:COP9 signalosome [Sphaerosporella brunnea]|uniref:Eukaryotic translation initiation factor 3 subunit K n=1 Tax=Sphaerosporella brunnea TaxID=1250544 RepID=A0A5J5FAT3_9PEZI|nr:COP9 signalosome [Sphaerosporella brunnea]
MTTRPMPADSRPEHIDAILAGLDRYNPETVSTFQDYVQYQCENRTYDALANLALLKLGVVKDEHSSQRFLLPERGSNAPQHEANTTVFLNLTTRIAIAFSFPVVMVYQFNPHLTKEETITNILVKALTIFPSPDFSLCLHLLPPNILDAATATDALSDAVRKLTTLNELIESGSYREFWVAYESDDLYADLVADCAGFEDTMRDAIALQISMIAREVSKELAQGWLNVSAEDLPEVITRLGWTIEGDKVKLPINKENEAKTTVFRENVQFNQFHNVIRRGFEQAV